MSRHSEGTFSLTYTVCSLLPQPFFFLSRLLQLCLGWKILKSEFLICRKTSLKSKEEENKITYFRRFQRVGFFGLFAGTDRFRTTSWLPEDSLSFSFLKKNSSLQYFFPVFIPVIGSWHPPGHEPRVKSQKIVTYFMRPPMFIACTKFHLKMCP